MNNYDFVGFVPSRMDIAESVMYNFPQNVLFGKYGIKDGKNVFGTALYKPDLESLKQEEDKWSMKYINVYGSDSWLFIHYDSKLKSYRGEKYIDGASSGLAIGADWQMFF